MKNKVYIFNEYGARVLINPPDIEDLRKQENVLVNPDISQVRGIPHHLWKKVGESIIPINISDPENIVHIQEARTNPNLHTVYKDKLLILLSLNLIVSIFCLINLCLK